MRPPALRLSEGSKRKQLPTTHHTNMARALVFIAVTTFVVAVKATRPLEVANSVHTLAMEGASELEEKFQAWAEKHNVKFQSNDERSERLDLLQGTTGRTLMGRRRGP